MKTSANLYFIKKNNRYLNGKSNTWHDKVIMSTYATSEIKALEIAKYYNILDFEIEVIKEFDYTGLLASETTRLIIQMDSILVQLEVVRCQIPTISQVNKVTYKNIKSATESLRVINPYFNAFVKENEDTTYDVKGIYEDFIHQLSKIEIYDCSNLSAIFKAYAKDRDSIMGIANKIMR